jgi:predicted phosphoribosyltransferase
MAVFGLPRGGVVPAFEVARELHLPLGLVMVCKIGHPSAPEYAIGALAEDQPPVYNEHEAAGINPNWLANAEAEARRTNAHRREVCYGEDFVPPDPKGKTVLLVDDGMATGLTMEAAARALLVAGAHRVVVAAPVASRESIDTLSQLAAEINVLDNPDNFAGAVGGHYTRFGQVDDMDVKSMLWEAGVSM